MANVSKEVRRDKERKGMGHGGIPVLLRVSGHPSWETSHYLHLIRGWWGTAARVRYRCERRRGGDSGNRRAGEQKGGGEEDEAKGWRAMEERREGWRGTEGRGGKGRGGEGFKSDGVMN